MRNKIDSKNRASVLKEEPKIDQLSDQEQPKTEQEENQLKGALNSLKRTDKDHKHQLGRWETRLLWLGLDKVVNGWRLLTQDEDQGKVLV